MNEPKTNNWNDLPESEQKALQNYVDASENIFSIQGNDYYYGSQHGVLANGSSQINSFGSLVSEGGIVLGGSSEESEFDITYTEGGIVVSGNGSISYDEVGSEGVILAGNARFFDEKEGEGGLLLGGVAGYSVDNLIIVHYELGFGGVETNGQGLISWFEEGQNGIDVNGEHLLDIQLNIVSNSNTQVSGFSLNNLIIEDAIIAAGVISSGTSSIPFSASETASGGLEIAGVFLLSQEEQVSGGLVVNGISEIPQADGLEVSGSALIQIEYNEISINSIVLNGQAQVLQEFSERLEGGILAGNPIVNDYLYDFHTSEGGVNLSGISPNFKDSSSVQFFPEGVNAGGESLPVFVKAIIIEGGLNLGGETPVSLIIPEFGLVVEGVVDYGMVYVNSFEGGLTFGGIAEPESDTKTVKGGMVASGSVVPTLFFVDKDAGGLIVGGYSRKSTIKAKQNIMIPKESCNDPEPTRAVQGKNSNANAGYDKPLLPSVTVCEVQKDKRGGRRRLLERYKNRVIPDDEFSTN